MEATPNAATRRGRWRERLAKSDEMRIREFPRSMAMGGMLLGMLLLGASIFLLWSPPHRIQGVVGLVTGPAIVVQWYAVLRRREAPRDPRWPKVYLWAHLVFVLGYLATLIARTWLQ